MAIHINIDQFPSAIITTEQLTASTACSICLEEYIAGTSVVCTLPCSHFFHRVCLQRWLNPGKTCPYCRSTLPATYTNTPYFSSAQIRSRNSYRNQSRGRNQSRNRSGGRSQSRNRRSRSRRGRSTERN